MYLNRQSIVGKLNTSRQSFVGFVMKSYLMGEVDEICTTSTNATSKGDGIVDKLMAVVRFVKTQGIDHKCVNTIEIL